MIFASPEAKVGVKHQLPVPAETTGIEMVNGTDLGIS
jgi:hypothetical protein